MELGGLRVPRPIMAVYPGSSIVLWKKTGWEAHGVGSHNDTRERLSYGE